MKTGYENIGGILFPVTYLDNTIIIDYPNRLFCDRIKQKPIVQDTTNSIIQDNTNSIVQDTTNTIIQDTTNKIVQGNENN